MSKARELAALGNAYSDGALSNRNLIINGAMQVAQRGTSQTAAGYGSIDRFALSLSGATATMTQESLALGQTDIPSQFQKFLRVATTTGDNYCGVYHRIEDVNTVEGSVVLSFYAKGSNPAAGSFEVYLVQNFGTGGSTAVVTTSQYITVTSSWQRFELVFTLASLSGKTIGTGSNVEFDIVQAGADTGTSAWTLDITGVQLEVGDTATPFEHRSYGQELALCQRYYQTNNDATGQPWFRSGTVGSSATGNRESAPLLGKMRVAPSTTLSSTSLINCATGYPSVGYTTDTALTINCAVNTSGSHFRYGIYWTADAEL